MAILLVLFYHYVWGALRPEAGRIYTFVHAVFPLTWSGVDLFFVLSGFLIGGILMDQRHTEKYFKTFYIRRICRILPLYFLCLALYVIFRSVLAVYSSHVWFTNLFDGNIPLWANATFTQNIVAAISLRHNSGWLGVTWTLVVEEQFYLLLPITIWIVRPSWLMPMLLTVIGLNITLHLYLWMFYPEMYACFGLIPLRANGLLFGVICACLLRRKKFRNWFAEYRGCLYLLLGVFILGIGYIGPKFNLTYYEFDRILYYYLWLDLFYVCLVLLAITERKGIISNIMRFPPLRNVGIMAYGIYLFHAAINGLLHGLILGRGYYLGRLSDWVMTFVALFATLLFAFISWHFFEKPIIRWGHAFSYSGKAHPAIKAPIAV